MGSTIAQKLIKSHLLSGDMTVGSEIGLRIDQTLTQDATGTMAYLEFEAMGVERVKTELSVAYIDHNTLQTGFEKYVACMEEYTNAYTEFPKWYAYTREMLSYAMEENIETELNINDVFWQFTDREIPIPALVALREGIADGSIRPDIDIHMIYQILVNAYTGTNIYDGTKYAIDAVETLRTSSAIIANYIKNDT